MSTTLSAGEIVRAMIQRDIEDERGSGGRQRTEPRPSTIRNPNATAQPSRFNVRIPLKDGRLLAYNTLSGAFAIWSQEDVALYDLALAGVLQLGDERLRDFAAAGYLVAEDAETQLDQLNQRYQSTRFDSGTLTVTIAPTSACNFACDYCFQGLDKPNHKISKEVQDAFIRYLASRLSQLKQLSIVWYGGEPLMGLAAIRSLSKRMLALCKKARVKYSAFIVTNGWYFTREVAAELYSLKVNSAQITFDGPAMYHDMRRPLLTGRPTYERIVTNLREVVEQVPIRISVRVNIDERNKDQVRELLDDLTTRGFGGRSNFGIYFAPVESITEPCHGCSQVNMGKQAYGRMEADLYRYAVERGLCGLPKPSLFMGNCQAVRRNGLLLAANGDLHKCWDTMHDPSLKVGTIFETENIEAHPLFQRWMQWTPFANPVCSSCKILPICTGFCGYKFVHPDKTRGEAGSLPCPSWKFNFNERIFLRAEKMGLVRRDEIADEALATTISSVGANHDVLGFELITAAAKLQSIPIVLGTPSRAEARIEAVES